jgi:hypothetical protein
LREIDAVTTITGPRDRNIKRDTRLSEIFESFWDAELYDFPSRDRRSDAIRRGGQKIVNGQ